MKKFTLTLFVFISAFMLAAFEIVIPDEAGKLVFPPNDTYQYPADFLQRHIQKSTGKKLPIVKESKASKNKRKIFIGNTKAAQKFKFTCKPEELILQPVGNDLIITGEITPEGIDRGTLFGVYEYLEREFGIRFLYADNPRWNSYGPGTVIPKKSEITFPKKTVRSAPTFRQREGGVGYYSQKTPIQKLWHPVLRFGSSLPRQNANHTQVYWYELYSKTHPEYFAKSASGKVRLNHKHVYRNYICLSSDEVLNRMMQNIADCDAGVKGAERTFGPRPPKGDYVYFACNDGLVTRTTCHCAKCAPMLEPKRIYEAQGTELFFNFTTKYAARIKEKYPNRKLAVLAYSHYLAPPKKSVIPDNMEVTYVGPKIHYATDPAIYNLHSNYIKQWHKLLKNDKSRMTLWMNIVNPQVYLSNCPFMYHHVFQKFMKDHQHMISGAFINGLCPYLRRLGARGFYGTIHTIPMIYLQGRIMWDINANVDDILKDFCDKSYGKGGKAMLEFYNLVTARWEARYSDNESMPEYDYIHQIRYPQPVVAKMKALLNEAAKAAIGDKYSYRRIIYLRDNVYSRFFKESKEFHEMDRLRRVYECYPAAKPPVIDGKDDDIQWQNTYPMELIKFQRGEKSKRKSQIKLLYHGKKLYFLAEFFNPTDKDELRIQSALTYNQMKGIYAANINRYWRTLMELRIDKNGKTTRFGNFPSCEFKITEKDGRRIIEGAFPYDQIANGMPYMPSMRLQFIRYAYVWDDYETTAPTLGSISDYPTWRFLIVDLLPASKVVRDGLE